MGKCGAAASRRFQRRARGAQNQGQKYVGSILTNVAPDMLYLQMTPSGAEAGADVLNYANAPSDVSDSLGRFLAAFDGFPLA